MSLFPWAKFRKTNCAIKIHTLLNLQNNIPSFIGITDGSVHDVNILDEFISEIGGGFGEDPIELGLKLLFNKIFICSSCKFVKTFF